MQFLQDTRLQIIIRPIRRIAIGLLVALVGVLTISTASAQAAKTYTAADGTDITAIAECIPSELADGNLDRALSEAGNDFLEKVFNTKDSYDEYELADSEIEYLECLKSKGVTPEVEKIEM